MGLKFWRGFGILDPLMHAHINEISDFATNCVVRAILHACATLGSTGTKLR
jgi:hypothetical protein